MANAIPNDNYETQYANVEGPVWLDGSLYFSEFRLGDSPPPSRIVRITGAAAGEVVAGTAGTNGLATDRAGQLYGASHKVGGIVRFALPGGAETVLVGSHGGKRFNSPNDLTVRSDGTIYFTDPSYQAPSPRPQASTRVYRLAPGASAATVVDESRNDPNGITLSPDEKTLYVTANDGLFRYDVAADGTVGPAQRFGDVGYLSGDGMVVDCAGNLYVTKGSVVVVSPEGKEIARIALPGDQQVTNVAFGAADRKTLYITAMGSTNSRGIYKVDLAVPGYPY